ncbi:hypothetical protein JRO89_XSUnG0035500 [Xanthoceras sorbifolium]|uniref:Protein kinase domain-containing protein n=1 Tax=Xanthoceras sorbifolium TaxID=99658 RepID=A0ABQ8H028_9ROSI|nr:hypothetical protein JRO89_XSUnG0035500 [Xanthoceras sorbifolium]
MSSNRYLGIYGLARGLAYIHTLEKQIIYRDFKSSSILLDAVGILSRYLPDCKPKFSDFSLAELGHSGDKTHVTTRQMGTFGYAAPEYT